MKTLFFLLFITINIFAQNKRLKANVDQASTRTIEIDILKEKGKMSRAWQKCIGAGRANEGLRAD